MLLKERLNNNYDFLRVFAALCITFTHSYGLLSSYENEPIVKLTKEFSFAFIGLSIFFSISGYLIAKSAITSSSFKNYIWKRFLRIQPVLVLTCILTVFIVGPFFSSLNFGQYFTNWKTYTYFRNVMPVFGIQFNLPQVFINNSVGDSVNGSLWTLIVEERLYLILGLLFMFKSYGKIFMVISISILNILYCFNTVFFNGNLIKYLNNDHIFYALIFLNSSAFLLLKINFLKYSKSFLIFLLIFVLLILSIASEFEKSLQVILLPLLVILIAHLKGMTNNIGKYGDFTYGIYAFSFPVQQMLVASKLENDPLILFIVTLLIVTPLAILSWHLLEKKMLLLKMFIK